MEMASSVGIRVATVVEVIERVKARIRIPSLHGMSGSSTAVPNASLPVALPCVPPVLGGERYNINIEVGDKLYVVEGDGFFLYMGKEYSRQTDGKWYDLYATNTDMANKVISFGGLTVSCTNNVVELIAGTNFDGELSDYCGLRMDVGKGEIALISKKGNSKVFLALNATEKASVNRVVVDGDIKSECVLGTGGGINLESRGPVALRGSSISEVEDASIGNDNRAWEGKTK
jgi:hypothetical protein